VLSSYTMPTCAADLPQIQDSIAKLTTAFSELCATQDQRHEINVLSVQALQTQIVEFQQTSFSSSPIITSSYILFTHYNI